MYDAYVYQTVKKSAKVIIERYYPKLTLDFETNKRICDEIAIIASKRLRNKVSRSIPAQKAGLHDTKVPILIDRRLHHPSYEAHSTRTSPWYLVQAARRGT